MKNRDEEGPMDDGVPSSETLDCGSVRDLLPLCVLGILSADDSRAVANHLRSCGDCRGEESFLVRLEEARQEPPADLRNRIVASLDKGSRGLGRVWGWGVPAAAAVIAVALGLGIFSDPGPSNEEIWSLAFQAEAPTEWVGEDWMVAGAPVLQALSDEILREVLLELDP